MVLDSKLLRGYPGGFAPAAVDTMPFMPLCQGWRFWVMESVESTTTLCPAADLRRQDVVIINTLLKVPVKINTRIEYPTSNTQNTSHHQYLTLRRQKQTPSPVQVFTRAAASQSGSQHNGEREPTPSLPAQGNGDATTCMRATRY